MKFSFKLGPDNRNQHSASNIIEGLLKNGSQIYQSDDPLTEAIKIVGRKGIGEVLSNFSASQCAGLLGVVVTSIAPQASIPLMLKKISDDIDYMKKSLDKVTNNSQVSITYIYKVYNVHYVHLC